MENVHGLIDYHSLDYRRLLHVWNACLYFYRDAGKKQNIASSSGWYFDVDMRNIVFIGNILHKFYINESIYKNSYLILGLLTFFIDAEILEASSFYHAKMNSKISFQIKSWMCRFEMGRHTTVNCLRNEEHIIADILSSGARFN